MQVTIFNVVTSSEAVCYSFNGNSEITLVSTVCGIIHRWGGKAVCNRAVYIKSLANWLGRRHVAAQPAWRALFVSTRVAHCRRAFLSYTKTNRNIIRETTTVTDWKAFYTPVNLLLPLKQDFRTIKRATRGEADLNISLLIKHCITMHCPEEVHPSLVMRGHKQLFTLSGTNTVPFLLSWQTLVYLEFWFS